MATVVNSGALLALFTKLGWTSSPQDLLQAALNSGVSASVVDAYLTALASSPDGLNDQTIAGVTTAQGTAITNFLKTKGLVGT